MPVFCTENRFLIWRVSFDSWWSFARVIWDTKEGLSVKVFSMAVLGLSRLKCVLFKEGLNREKRYIDRWINGLLCCWCKISWHRLVNCKKPQKQRVCLGAQMILFFIFIWYNHKNRSERSESHPILPWLRSRMSYGQTSSDQTGSLKTPNRFRNLLWQSLPELN